MKNAVLIFVTLFLSHGAFSNDFSDELLSILEEGGEAYQDYLDLPPELQDMTLEIAFKQAVIESIDQAFYVNEALGLNNVNSNQRTILSVPLAIVTLYITKVAKTLANKALRLVTPNENVDRLTLRAMSKDIELKILDTEDQIEKLKNRKEAIARGEVVSNKSTETKASISSQATESKTSTNGNAKMSETAQSEGVQKAKASNGSAEVADEVQPEKAKAPTNGNAKMSETAQSEGVQKAKQQSKRKLSQAEHQEIRSIKKEIGALKVKNYLLLKRLDKHNRVAKRGFAGKTLHVFGRLSRGLGYTALFLAQIGVWAFVTADTLMIVTESDIEMRFIKETYQRDIENFEKLVNSY